MSEKRFYKLEWWEITIDKNIPLSFTYAELPVEELMACDEISKQHPGLRFNLRKQRGARYLLTILPSRDIDEPVVKGQP